MFTLPHRSRLHASPARRVATSSVAILAAIAGVLLTETAAFAQSAPPAAPKADAPATSDKPDEKPGQKVVARVDGTPITEADIELAEEEIGAQLQGYPAPVRRKVVIEFLIENQLFAKAAAASNVEASAQYKQRLAYWRRRMLRDTYFETVVRAGISDADAKAFYDQKVASVKGGDEVKASHILVATQAEADALYKKIAAGADFAEMAKQHSKDPGTKDTGGSLGYFAKGRMVPAFDTAAFQLKVGEVSLPVKSKFGWHLIKVEDKRERKPPPFEAIKDRIITAMVREKARGIGTELRTSAKIEYVGDAPRLKMQAVPPPTDGKK